MPQFSIAFLLHLLYLDFWGAGSPHLYNCPRPGKLGCAPTSLKLKIKFPTSQVEAGCATQHIWAWAHSYLKPACSLPEAQIIPSCPAITSPPQQQRWLEGRISWTSWWSPYLPMGHKWFPTLCHPDSHLLRPASNTASVVPSSWLSGLKM